MLQVRASSPRAAGAALALLLAAVASCAHPGGSARDAAARVEALEAMLLARDSATLALDDWCARERLAAPGETVVAERLTGAAKPATDEIRRVLEVEADTPVAYRRVTLRCGDVALSLADNWYVPSRLPDDVNRRLETSDIAFGRAVRALDFRRERLEARVLWPEPSRRPEEPVPEAVIEHRARLVLPDGRPISYVVETYLRDGIVTSE